MPTITDQVVTAAEIDEFPTVAPLLARWRQLRADAARITADRRSSDRRIDVAEQAARSAGEDYRVAAQREGARLLRERTQYDQRLYRYRVDRALARYVATHGEPPAEQPGSILAHLDTGERIGCECDRHAPWKCRGAIDARDGRCSCECHGRLGSSI